MYDYEDLMAMTEELVRRGRCNLFIYLFVMDIVACYIYL